MKKFGSLINLFLAFTLLTATAIMATSNEFDIWTSGYEYIDTTSRSSTLKLQALEKRVGSTSEISLKINDVKKIGSKTENTYYVTGGTRIGSQLPIILNVYKSDKDGRRIGSSTEGEIQIEVGNKELVKGLFLDEAFEAYAFEIE